MTLWLVADLAGRIRRDYIRRPQHSQELAMASDKTATWRSFPLALAIATGAAFAPAHAALKISNSPTVHVSCSAGVCTTTGASANLNVTDLTNMLASADIVVKTDAGSQDIYVRAPITWASTSRLTLDAYRSTTVRSPIVVEGIAGLTLTAGDGDPAGRLTFSANVTFWDLTSSLIVNGHAYILIGDIATLASDIAAAPSGRYALAKTYDATADGTYPSAPIPTTFTGAFEGLGNTISHFTLADSTAGQSTGFFTQLMPGAKISDLNLFNTTMSTTKQHSGGAGMLVGFNDGGAIAGVHVQGRMTCRGAGDSNIGGIAGANISGASIASSEANVIIKIEEARSAFVGVLAGINESAAIGNSSSGGRIGQTGTHFSAVAGGLVGSNSFSGTISSSQSAAAVSKAQYAGGLAGTNVGSISDSFATGDVSNGSSAAGGLVGQNGGAITNVHAGGNVSGAAAAGGLIGNNFGGTITGASATGNVTGTGDTGGVVGTDSSFNSTGGTIAEAYATGTVTGGDGSAVGGIVGRISTGSLGQPGGSVSQSFATGTVSGGNGASVGGVAGVVTVGSVNDTYAMGSVTGGTNAHAGGLVGTNGLDASDPGTIGTSYSTGTVSAGAGSSIGGLLGFQTAGAGSVAFSYWDTDTSGITNLSQGAGNVSNDPGITGQTSAQLKSGIPSGFNTSVWTQASGINGDFPFLISTPPN